MERQYDLYRRVHDDGSAHEWAITCLPAAGQVILRFGAEGHLVRERQLWVPDVETEYLRRIEAKRRKGYVAMGPVCLDRRGRPYNPSQQAAKTLQSSALSWTLRVRDAPVAIPQLIRPRLFDVAQCLVEHGRASVSDQGVQLGAWSLTFTPDRLPGLNQISLSSGEGAGFIDADDGPYPLMLLMALRQHLPPGSSLTIAGPTGLQVPEQLKTAQSALAMLGTDLEQIRPLAEVLNLLPPRIDLQRIAPQGPDFYF